MTINEAKLLLQACRPDGSDATTPAFAEALALAARDPELKAWWEARQSFDRKIAAKLAEITPPADLRAKILVARPKPRTSLIYRLAIAASIAGLIVIGASLLLAPNSDRLQVAAYDAAAIHFLGDDSPSLGTTSENSAALMAWLKERHSPTGTLPQRMTDLSSVGCQTFAVSGHTVSLICFSLADGGIAHLFIVDKSALADPPGDSPSFAQDGSWSTVTWSDTGKTYLLVTEAGADKLKKLL